MQTSSNLQHENIPYSIEAEKSVLGCVLMRPSLFDEICQSIFPEDFYSKENQVLYEELVNMINNNEAIDLLTVCDKMVSKEKDKVDASYITELFEYVAMPENIHEHARIVKGCSARRMLIEFSMETMKIAKESSDDINLMLSTVQQKAFALDDHSNNQDVRKFSELLPDWYEKYESIKNGDKTLQGADTGYESINMLTRGFQNTDLIILAARPSMGKTALALNFLANNKGNPGLFFSLEMGKSQLITRSLSIKSGVQLDKIVEANASEEEERKLYDIYNDYVKNDLLVDDRPSLDINTIRSTARKYKKKYDISYVIIDYMQLITVSEKFYNREREVAHISSSLKAMAKELDIPVIALAQLNRKLEERNNKRPKLSDLRESGSIEQDADLIMFLYRDEVYNPSNDNPNTGKAEIIIGKQRNGPTGTATLSFNEKTGQFAEDGVHL